jgi:spore coat polysaccharide biosynthesis predicted glycosyltransferase SpsG
MRFLLRADAGVRTGTGHVMRCLTLAEELLRREHTVVLEGAIEVPWVQAQVAAAGVEHRSAVSGVLDVAGIVAGGWDAVVIDSYDLSPAEVSRLAGDVAVLAVIDGEHRGIIASRYVDPNLGADERSYGPGVDGRLLAGSRYALVRRSITALRRPDRWRLGAPPRVLAFFGGSDPVGAMPRVARALAPHLDGVEATLIVPPRWHDETVAAVRGRTVRVIPPTPDLPAELDRADIVVSAAGTSAWDLATMASPAVLAAVVDNQRDGLAAIVSAGVAVAVDAHDDPERLDEVGGLVAALLADEPRRRALSERCFEIFDGRGAARVADALEQLG